MKMLLLHKHHIWTCWIFHSAQMPKILPLQISYKPSLLYPIERNEHFWANNPNIGCAAYAKICSVNTNYKFNWFVGIQQEAKN